MSIIRSYDVLGNKNQKIIIIKNEDTNRYCVAFFDSLRKEYSKSLWFASLEKANKEALKRCKEINDK